MAKIQITQGSASDANLTQLHLISNHMIDQTKGIDELVLYTEKRHLSTFLAAGVTDGKYTAPTYTGKDTARTKIGMIPENELIDKKGWSYRIMGRIQKACEIVGTSAVGTVTTGSSTQGGFFSLGLKDNYLHPGDVVTFYNGKQARVTGTPTGGTGNYIYRFQTYTGDTFSWTTWVAPQTGTKTCFGGGSTFGERSIKGYGNVHYPDRFINHTTIQRAACSISGDANVYWYELDKQNRGFVYESEQQMRAVFSRKDEWQKWWGKSTMKDSNGNLLTTPAQMDFESGLPVWAGDGLIPQIEGANDMTASGVGGNATYSDFSDMMSSIKKKFDQVEGQLIYAVTGSDGMDNAHDQIATYGKNFYNITHNINQDNTAGGASPAIGFRFNVMNVGGNQIVFVENELMNDEQLFPRKLTNGKSAMGSTYYFIDASTLEGGKRNIEIKTRGRDGINRGMVHYMETGMTGHGTPQSSVDADRIEILKENMIVAYNTSTCGILAPSATA